MIDKTTEFEQWVIQYWCLHSVILESGRIIIRLPELVLRNGFCYFKEICTLGVVVKSYGALQDVPEREIFNVLGSGFCVSINAGISYAGGIDWDRTVAASMMQHMLIRQLA